MSDRTVRRLGHVGAWKDCEWEEVRALHLIRIFEPDGTPVSDAHGVTEFRVVRIQPDGSFLVEQSVPTVTRFTKDGS